MQPRRVLVAYITRGGYVRKVAQVIADRLGEHGLEVDIADLEICIRYPERYDGVVLACAVRFGRHAETLVRFIDEHRAALRARPTALLSVDRPASAAEHLERLYRRTQWRPERALAISAITGAPLRRARAALQGWLELEPATPVEAPTDWSRIAAFGDEVAGAIGASQRPGTTTARPPISPRRSRA